MEIAQGKIGAVATYDHKFEDGKVKAEIDIPVEALAEPALEKLKALIPGNVDDAFIDALEGVLKSS